MDATRRTEVDGVPVLLAPGAGPMRAGLVFRVGRADETAPTAGVTHLVEHLALHRHGGPGHDTNGMTGMTTTQFVAQGTPESVAAFLRDVCAGLRELPLDRLAVERRILGTEEENRADSVSQPLAVYRYGARDYGLAGLPEWGIHALTAEQVAEWARARFNRANAVLWIAGDDLPPELRLDLPDGQRWPLPSESSALPVTPAWFTGAAPAVVMDAPVPRTRASAAYASLLQRALFRQLRQDRGLSYTAAAAYTTDGRPHAFVTAVADGRPEQLGEVVDGFLAEVHRLAGTEADPAELEAVRTRELTALDRPDAEANLLPRRAVDLVCGYASPTTAELADGFRSLTAADVREVAAGVERSALLMVPRAAMRRSPAGFEAAPTLSRFAVTGTRHRSRIDPDTALVVGADGVSLIRPHGPSTVLFADCVAALRFPDGARHLIGPDAIGVSIEPTLFAAPKDLTSRIDAALPPHLLIDLPPRSDDAIPRPSRTTGLRARVRRLTGPARTRFDRFAMHRGGAKRTLLNIALTLAALVLAIIVTVTSQRPSGWLAVGGLAVFTWRRWYRR
ncbi:insulinase family protein [Dactylosporangium sp. CA-052675]|uniref:insulinase family protein n=1 Tax=Dactylosporangium sp. CA-052675 TaxID=3239927 RepID=UPI003D8AB3D4